ncbi:type II toxin-antitoxin system antitoxin SocA domain-containing protein [Bacillus albus]|uniref:Panacea domain-containing protein n=1 Tax=Bacillus albus TaxID=2026189 RepID=UPI003D1C2B36
MKINDVAEHFVQLGSLNSELAVTPKKIQKLLYYTQAWHLAIYDEPLFDEVVFEAWQHGPVCYDVYKQYRGFGYSPILSIVANPRIEEAKRRFIEAVWKVYGKFTGDQLEKLTHEEELWLNARGDLDPEEKCNEPISNEIMKATYKNMLQQYTHIKRGNIVELKTEEIKPNLEELLQCNKKSTASSLLQLTRQWQGDDFDECLRAVYENRGEIKL